LKPNKFIHRQNNTLESDPKIEEPTARDNDDTFVKNKWSKPTDVRTHEYVVHRSHNITGRRHEKSLRPDSQ